MRRIIVMMVILVLLALTVATVSASADHDSENVNWWWGEQAGTSTLVRSENGITANVSTSFSHEDLEDGSYADFAVTLWLVVFNEPEYCITTPCTGADLDAEGNPAAADVLYGAGHVIGGNEQANFGARLNEGDDSGSIFSGLGLADSEAAEVHYVIRSHGPKVPGQVDDMILTFLGGCENGILNMPPFGFDPPGGADELHLEVGDCQDIQSAVYEP